MKDFFQYLDTLEESTLPGSVRGELNKLQQWYDDNAIDKGLMSKKDPSDVKIYPILERPFDQIKKGGILVLGINPGAGNNAGKLFADAIKKVRAKDKAGRLPLVFDKAKGGWHYIITNERDGTAQVGIRKKNDDIKFSHFNTDQWYAAKNRGFKLHSKGSYNYYRAFNKMLDDLGMEEERPSLMQANWIPFPSVNTKKEVMSGGLKNELYRISTPWVESLIKVSKPKLIVCPLEVFDKLGKNIGISRENRLSVKGQYRSGRLKNDAQTPVVGFVHWTGFGALPTKSAWKKNIEAYKADIQELMK
jgi:hypothetical protein